jgi:hypothetical protein
VPCGSTSQSVLHGVAEVLVQQNNADVAVKPVSTTLALI